MILRYIKEVISKPSMKLLNLPPKNTKRGPLSMSEATLTDVANLAKVSSSAAGKVLNGGSDQIRVGTEARKRILQAARQLNYRTNMAASILAGGRSKLIGVFVDSGAAYRILRLLQEI